MTIETVENATFLPLEDTWDGDTYVLRAQVPGVDPTHDIDVTVNEGVLTVHAERKAERHETQEGRTFDEFTYGSFTRQVSLPAGTQPDDIGATYHDGVLEVRVPTQRGSAPQAERHVKVKAKRARKQKASQ